jgi:lipopolysaccharide transport system ATP-binding protein
MSSNIAIKVTNLGKCYEIYDKPSDRLRQMLSRGGRRYFKEFWALKNVSLEVRKGGSLAIIGRNGSGKSTLLQMICGTLSPTQGAVEVNGKVAALLELGAGFNMDFTGRENVYMAASLYGLSRSDINQRIDEIIAFADIGDHLDQPVRTYSSGMYVRLAFAVIAHVDADILIIDEALAVGDAVFTQKCMRFIDAFKKTGTIVFVSHDAATVSRVSEEAVWLTKGSVVASGSTPDVLELYHQYSLKEISSYYLYKKCDHAKEESFDLSNKAIHFNQINPKATIVGGGKAEIIQAAVLNFNGKPQNVFYGADDVKLTFTIKVTEQISSLLVGFTIKDKLGQKVIEENNSTYNEISRVDVNAGSLIKVFFEYKLPFMKAGKYFLDLAIAEGTQSNHMSLLWVYDAIEIESSPSIEVLGLISMGLKNFSIENFDAQ